LNINYIALDGRGKGKHEKCNMKQYPVVVIFPLKNAIQRKYYNISDNADDEKLKPDGIGKNNIDD
jgi:hypothetical protein